MKRITIKILLIVFGLTQLMAPLVHAHAGSDTGGTGLHAHLPQVSEALSIAPTALPSQLIVELRVGIVSEKKPVAGDTSYFALLADLPAPPVTESRTLRFSWPPVSLRESVRHHSRFGPRAPPVI